MGRKYGLGKYGRGTYDLGGGVSEIWDPEVSPPVSEIWVPEVTPPISEIWASAIETPSEIWIPVTPPSEIWIPVDVPVMPSGLRVRATVMRPSWSGLKNTKRAFDGRNRSI